jgi:hypothetical protein
MNTNKMSIDVDEEDKRIGENNIFGSEKEEANSWIE